MRLIVDAHLDLAWCALSFNRDLTQPLNEMNRLEAGMNDHPARGRATLSLPELRRAGVAVCVATLLARGGPERKLQPSFNRTDLDHANQSIAHAVAKGQLAYYRLLEQQGHVRIITTRRGLESHWQEYRRNPERAPLGIILSIEGADPVVTPEQVHEWWSAGLRAIGPAHYGRSHYAYGTAVEGPLSEMGLQLLREMRRCGMILDVTHLCDPSMTEAFAVFSGPVLASHHNCRALVPGDRQMTDGQIREVIARDGVIGLALDAWMIYPNWIRGQTKPEVVSLEDAANHIDHVCQLAGNTRHSGIGSDLDGGFGTEQTPRDLQTIRDLQKLGDILMGRGYTEADVDNIFHANWLRFFARALPE